LDSGGPVQHIRATRKQDAAHNKHQACRTRQADFGDTFHFNHLRKTAGLEKEITTSLTGNNTGKEQIVNC
jgi:hypothetical protein